MRRVTGPVVALALVLAGCGGSGGTKAAAPPTQASTTAAAPCPAMAVAGAPTDFTDAPGDFDGDGRPDRLSIFRIGSVGPWHVRVELAAGGAGEAQLPATAEGVKALGAARVDAGTAEAALAVVGTSPAGANVGLFAFKACRLERVTLAGSPAEFPIRAGATARNGFACQPPGLVAYSATSTDGKFFRSSTVSYLLLGSILDETHRDPGTPLGVDDPALARYSAFFCGSLKL